MDREKKGYFACTVSAIVWLVADVGSGRPYSNLFIPYWNSLIRFFFFFIITTLLSKLKVALEHEKELSTTDYLTGAMNLRYFYDVVQMEIYRLERTQRPFTLVYIDVDNFKTINDHFGHVEGDMVLQAIVSSIKTKIRKTDFVARLGGDEFALFFPETNQESAQAIMGKINENLVNEMKHRKIPVTLSIGVLTCSVSPSSISDLIEAADKLMYSAKQSGKDKVKYSIY